MALAVTTLVHIEEWPIYRKGFASLLQDAAEFSLVGVGGNLHDAIALTQTHRPNLIVLDINIPGNGIEAAKIIARQYPASRLVFLTASERPEHILAAFDCGALSYIRKNSEPQEILDGLRSAKLGQRFVSPALSSKTAKLKETSGDWIEQQFTAREADIVRLLTEGQTNREIAQRLAISEKTVKHRVTDIMQKLQVRNRVEATRAILKQLSGT